MVTPSLSFESLNARIAQAIDIYSVDGLVEQIAQATLDANLKPQQRDYMKAILYVGHNHLKPVEVRQYARAYTKGVYVVS